MKYVELIEAGYHYQQFVALHPLTVSFEKDKVTAIIGRSGSGKSTLLQLINGLLQPTSGSVHIDNTPLDYQYLQAIRLKTGYCVQGNGLFPHLNVSQNISIAGRIEPTILDANQRVDELLELTGLPAEYKKKYPHQLSGGEQQRVAICRALFLNPPLLLMDEPFGALDPITRYEMQQELLGIQKVAPRTILMVTHDLREASKLADEILVLNAGKLQQFGTRDEVIQSPVNDYVQQLIEVSLL